VQRFHSPAFGVILALASVALAQQPGDEGAVSRNRLKFMEETIGSLAATSDQIKSVADLRVAAKPLLRYSDPTRGMTEQNVLVDATVWRLGEAGRPTGLVTLELYRTTADAGVLAYEFASFTPAAFSLTHQNRPSIHWKATGSAISFRALEGSSAPAKTPAARLAQMRQLARRFSVQEIVKGEVIECRLLAQPIDRYQSAQDEIEDGAIFAFANGTNPELGLVLEEGKSGWTFGTVRLSSAEVVVKLDDREVARYERIVNARLHSDYTSMTEQIELPK
jgi:hypothetical protein